MHPNYNFIGFLWYKFCLDPLIYCLHFWHLVYFSLCDKTNKGKGKWGNRWVQNELDALYFLSVLKLQLGDAVGMSTFYFVQFS